MPGVLYHYTSAVAGRSIITNRELWATHIRYMNDADEYVRAHDLAAGMVEAEIPRALTDVHRQKLTRIADAVRLRAEAGERAGGPETSPMFVTSFSRSVDCAHGWQAYASRRGSPGCALVFDADGLAAAARRAHTSLRPCIHDDEAARAAMVAALEPVIREMGLHARLGDPPNAYMDPDFLRSISWEIAWVAACAKGPEWDVEQEERLIARPAIPDGLHVPVKYRERPGDSVSIPFVRIGLSDDASEFPLVGVLVGYSERQAEMVEEFRALLSTNGLQRAADGVRPPRVRYLPD